MRSDWSHGLELESHGWIVQLPRGLFCVSGRARYCQSRKCTYRCVCVCSCVLGSCERTGPERSAARGARRRSPCAPPTPARQSQEPARRGASAQRSLGLHHRMMSNAVRGVHVSGLHSCTVCFSPPAPPGRRRPTVHLDTRHTRPAHNDNRQSPDGRSTLGPTGHGARSLSPLQSRDNPAPKPTSHLSLRVCDLHPDCVKYL